MSVMWDEQAPEATSGRHPVNVGHLVMGVSFLGLAVVWALITFGAVGHDQIRWLLPVPWVLGGAVGLVASTVGTLRRPTR